MRAALALALPLAAVLATILALRSCDDAPGAPPESRVRTVEAAPARTPRARARVVDDAAVEKAVSSPAAPDAPAAAAPAPRLRIVDPQGNPVVAAGVWWTSSPLQVPQADAQTDLAGTASPPKDAERVWLFDRDGMREQALEPAPATTTAVARGLPSLEVLVRDGRGGAPVDADVELTVPPRETRHRLPAPGGRATVAALGFARAGRADYGVRAAAPEGWVSERPVAVDEEVAADATALRTTVVVYPEASVTLRAMLPGGAPVAAPVVAVAGADDAAWPLRVESLPVAGTFRVRGLPDLPSLRVALQVGCAAKVPDPSDPAREVDAARGAITPAFRPGRDATVDVVLDELWPDPATRLGGGAGGAFGGRRSTASRGPVLELRVRALRADGRPARVRVGPAGAGAGRDLAATNAEGRATLSLRAGRHVLVAHAPGVLPVAGVATLPGDADLVLREPPGRAFRAWFADDEGRALPFVAADVVAIRLPLLDGGDAPAEIALRPVVDGVQTVPLRADAAGALFLPRVPEGTLRVTGRLGDARGETETSDETARVVLRLAE